MKDDNLYLEEEPANVGEKYYEDPETGPELVQIEEEEETTLRVSPSSKTDQVIVETNNDSHENFSKLDGNRLKLIDFYRDARTFLEKANSTKFIVVAFILINSPILLMTGHLTELVYREIIIIIALTYLGVDAYEKRSVFRRK